MFNVQFSFAFQKCNTDEILFYLKIKPYTNIYIYDLCPCQGVRASLVFVQKYVFRRFSYYICERKSTGIIIYYTVVHGVNGVFSTHVQYSEIVSTRRFVHNVFFFKFYFE